MRSVLTAATISACESRSYNSLLRAARAAEKANHLAADEAPRSGARYTNRSANTAARSACHAARAASHLLAAPKNAAALSAAYSVSALRSVERQEAAILDASSLTQLSQTKHPPKNLFSQPLWHGSQRPQPHLDRWTAFSAPLSQNEPWDFWREWYQGFLDGKPLDWDLQHRVALIDDAIWDAGPETVAAEIERIKAEFNTPSSGKERFAKHEPKSASHLIENRIIASASLQGLAAQVTHSIERFHAETGANALPDALEPLTALPALLLAVNAAIQNAPSGGIATSDVEDQLRTEIGRLNAKVAELENELQKASASQSSVFSDAFKKQLGTSLGDWKLYAALCTGLWFVSGDTKGMQRRLENISHYQNMLFGEVSSPAQDAPASSSVFESPAIEI